MNAIFRALALACVTLWPLSAHAESSERSEGVHQFHICVVRNDYLHKTINSYFTLTSARLADAINAHFEFDAKRAALDMRERNERSEWHGLHPFCADTPFSNEELSLSYDAETKRLTVRIASKGERSLPLPLDSGFMMDVFGIQLSGAPLLLHPSTSPSR